MKTPKTPLLTNQEKAQILGDTSCKPLAATSASAYPPHRPLPPPLWGKRERYRVTILAGIICKRFIAVGADSRLTDVPDGSIENVDKISIVDFGKDQVLVAEGGVPAVTNCVVEIIRDKAAGKRISKWQDVAQVVEGAIRDFQAELNEFQMQHGKENPSVLLIAFYADNKPYLGTCNIFGFGTVEFAKRHYATAGVGKALADYLLSEFSEAGAEDELQLGTLTYTILKVKENNGLCAGPTRIKYLATFAHGPVSPRVTKATAIAYRLIRRVEKKMQKVDHLVKPIRNRAIFAALREASDEFATETHWQPPKS